MSKIVQTQEFLKKNIENFSLNEVIKLQNLIKYHSDLYYNKENPIISDKDYDVLFKKLEILEKKYSNKLNNFQTLKVGALLKESTFNKVKHSRPMISLDNTYNENDLLDFDQRVKKSLKIEENKDIEYALELKFDGLGIEIIYENGKYKQAITRGNGLEGEDVTENVRQIENIPKKITFKGKLEVRGEIVMPISIFDELNKKAKKNGEKVFSNPRNAASGSIRTKNILLTKKRKLQFFAYDLGDFSLFKSLKLTSYFETIKQIKKLGFETSPYFKISKNINYIINEINNFTNTKKFDFDIDGLVIKVNNINLRKEIGITQHHPKYAIAYKFPAKIFTTKIEYITHQIGRTGTITPVANLKTININGVEVKRATLHNYEEIEELDIRIGDIVFIKRAGEVIPKIISVVQTENRNNLKNIFPPKNCPSCGTILEKENGKVRIFCPNHNNCNAQIIEKLAYSIGKNGFNINGFGIKYIKKFYKLGFLSDLISIFKLKNYKNELLLLEGFQEKSVNNLLNSIENSKNINIVNFLVALNIFGIGKKNAKILAKFFTKKDDFLNFSYTIKDLENLEDIGPEIARNIFEYFHNKNNKILLGKLLEILNINFLKQESNINTQNKFYGKKFCITGSFILNGNKISRNKIIELLEEKGLKYISSISKNLDFLLVGDKAGSKLVKAEKLNIKILKLDYFKEILKTQKI